MSTEDNNDLEKLVSDIFKLGNMLHPENYRFLILYLQKKKSHKEKFTQFILNLNRIAMRIGDIEKDSHFELLKDKYIKVIRKTSEYYVLQLTDEGLEHARFLHYDKKIIIYSLDLKVITFIFKLAKVTLKIISYPFKQFLKLLNYVFIKHPMQTLKIVGLIIGIIAGVFGIIKFFKEM